MALVPIRPYTLPGPSGQELIVGGLDALTKALADQQLRQKQQHDIDLLAPLLAKRGLTTDQAVAAIRQGFADDLLKPQNPIKLGAGDILLDPATRQPIFTAPTEPSTAEQRVRAAGLTPGTPEAREFLLGRPPASTIGNLNLAGSQAQPQIVTVNGEPYAVIADPSAPGGIRVTPVAGTKTAVEREQAAAKEENRQRQQAISGGIVLDDINRALALSGQAYTTGVGGQFFGSVGGTAAHDLKALVDTIKSNVAFDRLQQMRNNSPTGGALGSISDGERAALESALGSLDQSQSKEQFQYNLKRLYNVVGDIVNGAGNGPRYQLQPQPGPGSAPPAAPATPPVTPPTSAPAAENKPQVPVRAGRDTAFRRDFSSMSLQELARVDVESLSPEELDAYIAEGRRRGF